MLTKCVDKLYIFNIYMYIQDLALNNLQWLTCHKTKLNKSQKMFCDLFKQL